MLKSLCNVVVHANRTVIAHDVDKDKTSVSAVQKLSVSCFRAQARDHICMKVEKILHMPRCVHSLMPLQICTPVVVSTHHMSCLL